MKRFLPAVALLAALTACGDDPTGPSEPDAHVSAQVDGAAWAANYKVDGGIAFFDDAADLLILNGAEVSASGARREVTIIIRGFTGTGTYTLAGSGSSSATYATSPSGAEWDQAVWRTDATNTGTVTVDFWDAGLLKVGGSFSFRAGLQGNTAETVTVTSGSFYGKVLIS